MADQLACSRRIAIPELCVCTCIHWRQLSLHKFTQPNNMRRQSSGYNSKYCSISSNKSILGNQSIMYTSSAGTSRLHLEEHTHNQTHTHTREHNEWLTHTATHSTSATCVSVHGTSRCKHFFCPYCQ